MEGPGVILALLYFPEILFAHFWDVGTPSPPALAKTFHLNGLPGLISPKYRLQRV
jgi:hypothetical protein